MNPKLADRVQAIGSWDDVKLLTVTVDRLQRWYRAGLLCIGDAAHAMSPIGGVGINLAIQDAVAAANILWRPLREGSVHEADLRKVQERREWPTRATQRLQLFIQDRVISNVLALKTRPAAPFAVKLLNWVPVASPHSGEAYRAWLSARACARARASAKGLALSALPQLQSFHARPPAISHFPCAG